MAMTTTLERREKMDALPPNKRAVVNDFTAVIRRHLDQGPAALAQLAQVAFERSLGAKATRQARTALAIARGLETRQQLMEAEGGSLSSEETARLLRISKTAVLKRLTAGRLLAWREERLQAARFPRWQFDKNGRVLPGLTRVLSCLQDDAGLDAWGMILFFLQTKSALGEKRPLDLLREGRVKEACLAAQAYAE